MRTVASLRRRRADRLLERGYALLDEHDVDEALAIADRLRAMRYSGAFELAARAHAAADRLEEAVRVLEDGVAAAPQVWINWQLLGNFRSDLGRYAEAADAYDRALACPRVRAPWVRLNQAILAGRTGDHARALALVDEVDDPELRLRKVEVRVGALAACGRGDEAERLATAALAAAADGAELSRIAATLGRVRMERGDSRAEVRAFLVDWWTRDVESGALLAAIRDLDAEYSEAAQYFRLLVSATCADGSYPPGYYVTWDVVADSPAEALEFIQALDTQEPLGELTIEDVDVLEPRPEDPKGVYWCTLRHYWEQE